MSIRALLGSGQGIALAILEPSSHSEGGSPQQPVHKCSQA
jgi:hypothetical protein